MDLVIMAAGMGSRFGGLKQIEPISKNGEFIIDYSIYDAIRAGFDRVIFIIKKENFETFKDTIGKRIEDKIKVEYVFQQLENLPQGFSVPEDRVKPWGTGHAILCCKDIVKDDFAIINADDFYGKNAFDTARNFMAHNQDKYGLVAYKVKNTISENGASKRGICKIKAGKLTGIIESSVERENGIIVATPLGANERYVIDDDTPVSMNMWCFRPNLFPVLEAEFKRFLTNDMPFAPYKSEFLIPDVIDSMIKSGMVEVMVKQTKSKWLGVTYKEDKASVVEGINQLVESGAYPTNLWANFEKKF